MASPPAGDAPLTLRFTVTADDVVALARRHAERSPPERRARRSRARTAAAAVAGFGLVLALASQRVAPLVLGGLLAGLLFTLGRWREARAAARVEASWRREVIQSASRFHLGLRELSLEGDALCVRHPMVEVRISLDAIERVERAPGHVFIEMGSWPPEVVPLAGLIAGDADLFVDAMNALMERRARRRASLPEGRSAGLSGGLSSETGTGTESESGSESDLSQPQPAGRHPAPAYDRPIGPEAPRYCLNCGYSLSGLASTTCPECGASFDPEDAATFDTADQVDMLWRQAMAACGLAIVASGSLLVFVLMGIGAGGGLAWSQLAHASAGLLGAPILSWRGVALWALVGGCAQAVGAALSWRAVAREPLRRLLIAYIVTRSLAVAGPVLSILLGAAPGSLGIYGLADVVLMLAVVTPFETPTALVALAWRRRRRLHG